jgi:hypothetical protein
VLNSRAFLGTFSTLGAVLVRLETSAMSSVDVGARS